jgi:hypothetical protein
VQPGSLVEQWRVLKACISAKYRIPRSWKVSAEFGGPRCFRSRLPTWVERRLGLFEEIHRSGRSPRMAAERGR